MSITNFLSIFYQLYFKLLNSSSLKVQLNKFSVEFALGISKDLRMKIMKGLILSNTILVLSGKISLITFVRITLLLIYFFETHYKLLLN